MLIKAILGLALAAVRLEAAEGGVIPGNLPAGVKVLEAPGIHNMFALGTNVYSGSSPEGEKAFEALAKLGIKTIITVDGAKPDLELAHKHGIRYVHLPHGYDGISTNTQAMIVKAAEGAEGSIYVHCHHGKHRGPAAAAVICMADKGWSAAQAEAWLVAAGTATNYTGLYEVVRSFQKPTEEQLKGLPAKFPEVATVAGLTEAMVEIDDRWEHLKAVRAAGYKTPKEHPDIKPANEAVILWEHYREAQRLPDAEKRGAKFIEHLKEAEGVAKEAERLLGLFASNASPEVKAQLDKSFDAMGKNCSSCHKAYRDPSGIKLRQ